MKNIDEINDNINELILQKSFDQLSADEKIKAIEYAGSEEEYNSLRSTLMAITSSFSDETDEVIEDKAMKNDLMNRFKQKHGEHVSDVKVIPIYRKPLFQLAVAASLTLLIVFSFPLFNNMNKSEQLAKVDVNNTEEFAPSNGQESLSVTNSNATEPLKNKTITEDKLTDEEELTVSEKVMEESPAPVLAEGIVSDRKIEYNEKEAIAEADNFSTVEKARLEEKANSPSKKGESLKRDQDLDETVSYAPTTTNTVSTNKTKNSVDKKKAKDEALAGIADDVAPAKPGSSNTANFVESNKTEILDLLFTVY